MTELVGEPARPLLDRLVALLAERPEVVAIALTGSRAVATADALSDIDLCVFTRGDIPVAAREIIVERSGGAARADVGLAYWGPGDEWLDAATGIEIDIAYFDIDWMDAEIRRVLREHRPALGYTTCFWHTIRGARPLHDPDGRLAALRAEAAVDYPEALRHHIIAFNHPVLRAIIPSYTAQIEKAVGRGDRVSVGHRLAALLASYFDILFAFNRVPHPGEKQLVARAEVLCVRLPENMAGDLDAVLAGAGTADPAFLIPLHRLLDRLDALLVAEFAPE